MDNKQPIKLFYSYSHEDDALRKELEKHLKSLQREGYIEPWHDRNITAGDEWKEQIDTHLENAEIILLLISSDFIASDYCYEIEMKTALQMHEEGKAVVIPVILRDCLWQSVTPFSKLQAIPTDGKAITGAYWNNHQDTAFTETAKQLKQKIEEIWQQKEIEIPVINLVSSESINKLSDAPKPRTYFTGREREIEDFKAAIDNGINLIVVDGPGGIGKTQFISRCIEIFIPTEKVIWYECTPASHLDTLISEAGYPELLKGSNKTDTEKFSAFKEKIQKNELFLFLDNFQETNGNPIFRAFLTFIQTYLKKGCVVVIDRDDLRSIDLTPKRIHIEGFKEKQLEYAKALIEHSYKDDVNITDEELENLCEKLQGYPLIIDLAILLLSQGETSKDIITKIVQFGDDEKISDRLLNAIFSRPDATQEEKDFITQFSIFTGRVSDNEVTAIIPETLITSARRKLQQKNLLSYTDGYYEIHPLVREFCYKELTNKEAIHVKVADYYISQRSDLVSPALEEQIFYHLIQSKQWPRIDSEIEEKGRKFILQGQLSLVKELLDRLTKIGINKPIFSILNGDIAEIRGKWDEAQAFYNIARQNNINKKIKIAGIIKYGEILYRKSDIMQSLQFFNEAYSLAKNSFIEEKARAANGIGAAYNWFGDKKLAIEYFNEAATMAHEIDDRELLASVLLTIGINFNDKREYDSALKKFREALTIFTSIGDKIGIASSIREMGNTLEERKKYSDAMRNYENSLSISEGIGDRRGISLSLGCIGVIYFRLNLFDESLKKYEESKKIAEEIGDKHILSSILNNIALIFEKQNKFGDAIKLHKKSIEIKTEISDIEGIAITSFNLGRIYASQPPFDYYSAILFLFKSVSINKKIGIKLKDAADSISEVIRIRGKVGLPSFKELAIKASSELDPDLQKYLPLSELFEAVK